MSVGFEFRRISRGKHADVGHPLTSRFISDRNGRLMPAQVFRFCYDKTPGISSVAG